MKTMGVGQAAEPAADRPGAPPRPRQTTRLAVLPRDRLDSPALLGVAAEQTARLQTARRRDEPGAESP